MHYDLNAVAQASLPQDVQRLVRWACSRRGDDPGWLDTGALGHVDLKCACIVFLEGFPSWEEARRDAIPCAVSPGPRCRWPPATLTLRRRAPAAVDPSALRQADGAVLGHVRLHADRSCRECAQRLWCVGIPVRAIRSLAAVRGAQQRPRGAACQVQSTTFLPRRSWFATASPRRTIAAPRTTRTRGPGRGWTASVAWWRSTARCATRGKVSS